MVVELLEVFYGFRRLKHGYFYSFVFYVLISLLLWWIVGVYGVRGGINFGLVSWDVMGFMIGLGFGECFFDLLLEPIRFEVKLSEYARVRAEVFEFLEEALSWCGSREAYDVVERM